MGRGDLGNDCLQGYLNEKIWFGSILDQEILTNHLHPWVSEFDLWLTSLLLYCVLYSQRWWWKRSDQTSVARTAFQIEQRQNESSQLQGQIWESVNPEEDIWWQNVSSMWSYFVMWIWSEIVPCTKLCSMWHIFHVCCLRDALHYQNGWIFGKVPNGLWPSPLIFG